MAGFQFSCKIAPGVLQQIIAKSSPGLLPKELLAKLGKHSVGKSCLYIRKLADVDMTVVEALIARALEHQHEGAA